MVQLNNDAPELSGAINCIIRDIARSVDLPINALPGKFDSSQAANILELKTPRTLDSWACRPDHGNLPFIKIGRSRKYLLTDIVTFIASRRVDIREFTQAAISAAVCEQVDRLSMAEVQVAAA